MQRFAWRLVLLKLIREAGFSSLCVSLQAVVFAAVAMSNWLPHGKVSRAMRALAHALWHVQQYGGYDDYEDDQSSWKNFGWKKEDWKNMIGKKKIGTKKIGKKKAGKIGKADGPTRTALHQVGKKQRNRNQLTKNQTCGWIINRKLFWRRSYQLHLLFRRQRPYRLIHQLCQLLPLKHWLQLLQRLQQSKMRARKKRPGYSIAG